MAISRRVGGALVGLVVGLSWMGAASAGEGRAGEVWARPERVEAQRRFLAWDAVGRPGASAGARYEVGDSRIFQVFDFVAQERRPVRCTLRASGPTSYVWVADDQYGPTRVTAEAVATFSTALEDETPAGSLDPGRGIVPLERDLFGDPPDVDGSGKVHVVLTDIGDTWTEGCGCGYVAGFFDPSDLDVEDPESNHADIVYVDTYPGIYTEGSAPNPAQVLGTLAHEHQHLIHAAYGALTLFQNEGQSEWASQITGYGARNVRYLALPESLGLPLMSWGEGEDVSWDYQRASLFHAWLAQRVGAEALGALTRDPAGDVAAYEALLAPLAWSAALRDFHLANWANDASLGLGLGYTDGAHEGVGVLEPTARFDLGGSTPSTSRALPMGGVDYLQWIGASGLRLSLGVAEGVAYTSLATPLGGGPASVRALSAGTTTTYPGAWESVLLVATGTDAGAERPYSFQVTWTPLGVAEQVLRVYDPATLGYFVDLPKNADEPAQAVRLTPSVTGELREVILGLTSFLDDRPNPTGEGALVLSLADSVPSLIDGELAYVPGTARGEVHVPFEALHPGLVTVDVREAGWTVVAGEDLQLVLSVEASTPGAHVTLDLDAGSTDERHPSYYPARTRRYVASDGAWSLTWKDHGNTVVAARVFGELLATPPVPVGRAPADTSPDTPQPVSMAWYPAQGASQYELQLSRDAAFTDLVLHQTALTTPLVTAPALDHGRTYFWRLRAHNGAGASAWSAASSFTTRAVPEGRESLSYINPDNVLWAVSLPFYDEQAGAVRFSPLLTGEVESVRVDLADLVGVPNPVGQGYLRVALCESRSAGGAGLEEVLLPGVERGAVMVPLGNLSPGPNVIDVAAEGWQVAGGEDVQIVVSVEPLSDDAEVILDLDDGDADLTNTAYHPARTHRWYATPDDWTSTWSKNGNIGVGLTIVDPAVTPAPGGEVLSYYDPDTLVWMASLPHGDETAWSTRLSPSIDGDLSRLELHLTTFSDGTSNPAGVGSLEITLTESEAAGGEGNDALLVPGAVVAELTVPFGDLRQGRNVIDLAGLGWGVRAGEDTHVVLRVRGAGSLSLELDDGSVDPSNGDYHPARTLRYIEGAGWDNTWTRNGNFAISATVGTPEEAPGPGCGGGGGRLGWPMVPALLVFVGRRRLNVRAAPRPSNPPT